MDIRNPTEDSFGKRNSRYDLILCENEGRVCASYYPNMAIANRVYPEHLGESFCDSYEAFYKERGNYAKGTGENLAIKLGLNATYG